MDNELTWAMNFLDWKVGGKPPVIGLMVGKGYDIERASQIVLKALRDMQGANMMEDITKRFLTDSEHTGRYIVTSVRTGKRYAVEPIGNPRTNWGDVNPSTNKVEGSYGEKYHGSVNPKDSMITQENGFKNIITLEPGVSPMSAIEFLDSKYPDKVVD